MFRNEDIERRRRSVDDVIAWTKLVSVIVGLGSFTAVLIIVGLLGYAVS